MRTNLTNTNKTSILYPQLSYKLQGLFFKIANQYGLGLKEKLYHETLKDYLNELQVAYEHEKQIPIFSWRDGRKISVYIPDFIIADKIILEIKSEPFLTRIFYNQIYSYLRVTKYELSYIVNFGEEKINTRRLIFTNDRKPHLNFKPK
ncbi:GxxExxY protein [Candidatus Gottesmanbacteria bacterium]|nr:GxxExxY protein [Candidatus Gottesmanbacteria bacterium]